MSQLVKNEVIVDTTKMIKNIQKIKHYIGQTEIIAVIKGNGYGHGLLESAKICDQENIKTFALGDIKEAIELRASGYKQKMLLLFPPTEANIEIISELNLMPTVYKREHLELIKKYDKNIAFDLEVDTGIGRSGCKIQDLANMMKFIKHNKLNINAAFTHLYNKTDYILVFGRLRKIGIKATACLNTLSLELVIETNIWI